MTLFPKYVTSVKMRSILWVVVLWLCAENVCVVKGQDCKFDLETININDTNVGEEIANIVVLEIAQFDSFYVQDALSAVNTTIAKKYFEFEKVDGTHLSFKTTADFKELGNDADSNGAELIFMSLYVTLKCGETTSQSPVYVAIRCSFNNAPTFSMTSYSYSVPVPIMQKTDITVYGEEITVTDTNFANTAMTFTIVPDDFEVAVSKIDNKHFKAVFSSKNILQFVGKKTFTLTAEDTGKRQTSVEITMAPDEKTSIDSPSFKESYYLFNYYDGEASMTPTNGDIVINSNKVNEATLTLEGENYADNFKIKLDNSSNTLYLSSDGNIPIDAPAQILLSLSFTTDSTAKTTLLINVAHVIPKFSNKFYSGTYDADSKEITWDEDISIEDAKSVRINEQSSLFSIDQTTYKITPKSDLTKLDFDENLNIIFTVVASSNTSDSSEAAVVISLKIKTADVLEFDSSYYTATYAQENGEWIVHLDSEIGFLNISDFSDIDIQVDESYSSNFKLEQDSSKWKVSILSRLTTEVLNNNRKLAIPLTASKTGLNATAVLILTLPDKVAINFGSLYYSASYVKGLQKDTVVLTDKISITGADANVITIIVEDYQEYLQLEHDSGSFYQLTVKETLNSTILNYESPLLITIAASTETSVAQTILVLDLPHQSLQLEFKKPLYHAKYIEEKIVLDDASINLIKTDTLDVQFSCEGYDENFELTQDSPGDSYSISVKSPLNDTSVSQLSIVISAFNTDSDISATTVLVITLPQDSQDFRFEKPYYSATYSVVGSKGVVTLAEKMQLIGPDNSNVSFYINDYNEYLKIDSDTGSSYTISLIQNLNSTALNHKSPLLIIIAASKDTSVTYTTLVLDLPDQSIQLEFEKPLYQAKYIEEKILLDDASINLIKTDTLDVQFSCQGYDENFELTQDSPGDSYSITVKSPLNDTSISQLSIVITAFNTDSDISASTVLIITLPQDSQDFKFEKPYYSATYSVVGSKGVVTLTEEMQLIGADNSPVSFYVNDYNEYLKIDSDSGSSYTISLIQNLNSTALNHKSPLLIIISASKDTSITYTTLVLDLPDQSLQLVFKKPFYHATYVEEKIVLDDASINLIKTDTLDVQFSCEGYDENFELTEDSPGDSYSITVKSPLNDTSIPQLSIVITAFNTDSDISASTVLVITLPQDSQAFRFEKPYYSATYSVAGSKGVVTLSEEIQLIGADNSKVSFYVNDYNEYLKIDSDSGSSYTISLIQNLNSTALNHKSPLLIIIAASKETSVTYTTLVLDLPDQLLQLEFEKPLYQATYIEEKIVLDDASINLIKTDTLEVKFSCEGYDENFELTQDSPGESYSITVKSPLNDTSISQLSIVITAFNTDSDISASTVLVITLPKDSQDFKFEKPYYSATYSVVGSKGVVTLTEKMHLIGADNSPVSFYVNDYNEYLKIDSESGSSYTISLIQNLNSTALNYKSPLLIIIAASKDTSVTYTTLVLDLPDQSLQLEFEKPLYQATYIEEKIVLVDANINLIKTNTLDVQFSCEGYDENFELTQDSPGDSYSITVKSPLNDTSISQLSIVITAFNTDSDISASTVLVITLPQDRQNFKFEKPYYSATYSVVGSKGVVTLAEEMQLIGADNSPVSFYVNDYNEYLKIDSDSGSSYTISLIQNLNSTALNHKSPLLIIIAASKDTSVTYTTLVLDLPDQLLQLEFKKPFYHATYIEEKIVLDDASINLIKTDTLDVQFSCEGYDGNFELTQESSGDSYSIAVKSPLNDTSISQLSIVITAFNTDSDISASTVLIITLPQDSQSVKFEKPYYSATYSVNSGSKDVVTLNDDIKLIGAGNSPVSFYVNEYQDYLKIESGSESSYTITVSQNLNSTALNYKSPLLIIIAASTGTSVTYTTLVLDLPEKSLQNIPEFEKFTYYGTYENSVDPEVKLEDKISLSADSIAASKIFIDPKDEYVEYFHLSESKEELLVTKPLVEDILDNVTSIALTLQAESEEGTYGHATIVLSLPRKVRDSSVEVENQQVLFTGTYQDGSFKSPSITLKTNATTDKDILVEITNDLGLDSTLYFSYKYSNQVLKIITIAELPADFLKSNNVLPLKLAIKDKSTKDTVYAVLNVDLSSNSNDDKGPSSKGARTGLIVAVSILAVLLLLILLGAFLFWFFKLRKTHGVEITPEDALVPTKTNTFTKNESKKQEMVSNALRRPTGIAIGLNPISQEESLTDDGLSTSVEPEVEKKVAFDENVEKIDNENDDDDENNGDSETMQSVTDRRPTKFVFGYPQELGDLGSSEKEDENRNSPEYIETDTVNAKSPDFSDGVKKKGVAFDQNVERIDIESEEDQESDNENSENPISELSLQV